MSAQQTHDIELIAKILAYKAAIDCNIPAAVSYAKSAYEYFIPTAKTMLENLRTNQDG